MAKRPHALCFYICFPCTFSMTTLGCSILNVMLHILFSKVFCKSKQWRNCFGDASAKVWMSSCYQWKCRRPVVSAFRCRTKILRKRLCSDTSEKVWMSSCYRFIVPCTYRCLVWSESFLVTLSSPNWKVWFQLQVRYATCVVVRLHMQVWCPDWQLCFLFAVVIRNLCDSPRACKWKCWFCMPFEVSYSYLLARFTNGATEWSI